MAIPSLSCNVGSSRPCPSFQSSVCPARRSRSRVRTIRTFNGRLRLRALQEQKASDLKDIAVVVVPGWFSDHSQYESMASYLRDKGFTMVTVPLKWYNWIPSLGGRSVRPVLDRIDATIALVLSKSSASPPIEDGQSVLLTGFGDGKAGESTIPYTFWDFLKEFLNPKNGAQGGLHPSSMVKEVRLLKNFPSKVILIAHSAGGWICRILLGRKVPYDGRTYAASQSVRALVTLGTPHLCTDKLTKRNMDFVNEHYPGVVEAEHGVQYICIAGKLVRGESRFGGLWKDFAWQSYELCCGRGDVWGDGVIPLECAVGLEGAQHLILEGVEHFPSVREQELRNWYGSPQVVDRWLPLLLSNLVSGEIEAVKKSSDEISQTVH